MMALGGSIGTGLFLGLGNAIEFTGSSIILAYLVGGLIMYIIMRSLGELVVHEPNIGAFSYYATKHVGGYLGYMSGWFAWFEYTIVCMQDLTASTIFLDHWCTIPHWLTIAFFLVLFVIINLFNVKVFGEFEFYFAGIKISAIMIMIMLFVFLLLFNHNLHNFIIYNWQQSLISSNLFSHGLSGFASALTLVLLSFGGTQFIGIAAAESENPKVQVPRAITGVVFRILFFYILSIIMLLGFYQIGKIVNNTNIFMTVLASTGISYASDIINFVIITAVLSAVNSCFYAANRMFYSLAQQGYAPKIFAGKYRQQQQVPKITILFTGAVIGITVVLNYLLPKTIVYYLLSFTIVSIIVTWSTILIVHFYFRKKGHISNYKLPFSPYTNFFAFAGLVLILIAMLQISYMKIAVIMLPISLMVITICYLLHKYKQLSK